MSRAVLVAGLGALLALVAIVVGVVSGDGRDEEHADETLVGPVWQWRALEGGDGSTVSPDDPAVYTLEFAADGTVAVRADCNRGVGTYVSTGGSLTIEIRGVTRALCPEGSLSDRYLRDLGFVRTYVIEGGTLYLNLLADAGNLVHVPAAE